MDDDVRYKWLPRSQPPGNALNPLATTLAPGYTLGPSGRAPWLLPRPWLRPGPPGCALGPLAKPSTPMAKCQAAPYLHQRGVLHGFVSLYILGLPTTSSMTSVWMVLGMPSWHWPLRISVPNVRLGAGA